MRSGLVSLLLPTEEQTDFLRAVLWSGDEARAAWLRWHRAVGDAKRGMIADDRGSKALLGLLRQAVRRNELAIEPAVRGALAVASFAEERRAEAYQRICARAFAALSAVSIRYLVLKGAALAETVYPGPSLRHSHDIDVLVQPQDLDRAVAALHSAGFLTAPDAARLCDPSGLPVELHVGLCRLPHYAPPLADIWGRSARCRIGATEVRTLAAADHLAHVVCQASCCGSRDTLKWVCDAWYLISHTPDVDWDLVLRTATASGAALPFAGLLEFLAVQLRAPVPDGLVDGLSAAARDADRTAYDAMLDGIRAGRRGRVRSMLSHARTNRERAAVLRWMRRRWRRAGSAPSRNSAPQMNTDEDR